MSDSFGDDGQRDTATAPVPIQPAASLDGRLGRVEGLLQALLTNQREEALRASESRGRLYESVEDIRAEVRQVGQDQAQTANRLSAIEATLEDRVMPVITRVERLELKTEGAVMAGGHAWRAVKVVTGAVLVLVTAFWREILSALRHI